jgi:hypothetical protein
MAVSNPNNPPQVQEPVLQENTFSFAWYQWFAVTLARALLSPVTSSVPATANASGVFGQIATDGNYLYVCVKANSWKRTALAAW